MIKGYKHSDETRKKMSDAKTGTTHSDETKRKISESVARHMARPEIKEKYRAALLGVKFSPEKIARLYTPERRERVRQKLVRRRQDGSISCVKDHYKFDLWRDAVRQRDNMTCRHCFKKDMPLNAHHIIPLADITNKYREELRAGNYNVPLLYDTDNGILLCDDCHHLMHGNPVKITKATLLGIIKSLKQEIEKKDFIIASLQKNL